MEKIQAKLTVFFEDPFWVGVCERVSNGKMEVCKITFGSEPKDGELHAFFLQHWNELCFSEPVKTDQLSPVKMNPKRMKRAIQKQRKVRGVSTKSQRALQQEYEKHKRAKKRESRKRINAEKQRRYELKRQKRKEKHRGK